jgi:hypothetical protein
VHEIRFAELLKKTSSMSSSSPSSSSSFLILAIRLWGSTSLLQFHDAVGNRAKCKSNSFTISPQDKSEVARRSGVIIKTKDSTNQEWELPKKNPRGRRTALITGL